MPCAVQPAGAAVGRGEAPDREGLTVGFDQQRQIAQDGAGRAVLVQRAVDAHGAVEGRPRDRAAGSQIGAQRPLEALVVEPGDVGEAGKTELGIEAAGDLAVARDLERAGGEIDHERQLRLRPDRLLAHALAAQIEAQAARRQLSGQREARRRHVGERWRRHGDVGRLQPDAAARIVRRPAQAEAAAEPAAQLRRAEAPEQGQRQLLERRLRHDLLRAQIEGAGDARLAEAQVQIADRDGAAGQGDGGRAGQAQRLVGQAPVEPFDAHARALAQGDAGASIELERRVGLAGRGDPDVQRRRCALGADAALPERQRALVEARQASGRR